MQLQDVVVKSTQPLRVAEASGTAAGYGTENLGPVFAELVPRVLRHLEGASARPGLHLAWYEEDGSGAITVHSAFEIGTQDVSSTEAVRVCDLPVLEVASVMFRGPMDSVGQTYEALMRWVADNGYRLAGQSRELYHAWYTDDPSRNVTEIQVPVVRT
jgi:effector-binding domain-containing protein